MLCLILNLDLLQRGLETKNICRIWLGELRVCHNVNLFIKFEIDEAIKAQTQLMADRGKLNSIFFLLLIPCKLDDEGLFEPRLGL